MVVVVLADIWQIVTLLSPLLSSPVPDCLTPPGLARLHTARLEEASQVVGRSWWTVMVVVVVMMVMMVVM